MNLFSWWKRKPSLAEAQNQKAFTPTDTLAEYTQADLYDAALHMIHPFPSNSPLDRRELQHDEKMWDQKQHTFVNYPPRLQREIDRWIDYGRKQLHKGKKYLEQQERRKQLFTQIAQKVNDRVSP